MIQIEENASLKRHNTFGISCYCRRLISYTESGDLATLYNQGCFKQRWIHLGAGANTLFLCDYFDGNVIVSANHSFEQNDSDSNDIIISVGNGWTWDSLVAETIRKGYFGAENLSGIPASLGGAVVQNIGAYGEEICNLIVNVEVFDTLSGKVDIFSNEDCKFAYRTSLFKHDNCNDIVVGASLKLKNNLTWTPNLQYAALRSLLGDNSSPEQIRRAVLQQRDSKLPSPAILGNAGSFFTNPIVSKEVADALISKYPDMPRFHALNGVKLAAGWLIQQAGLKGYKRGNAGVYDKNALVLVNLGNASGKDIIDLANYVSQSVFEKFGIRLYPEVRIIK